MSKVELLPTLTFDKSGAEFVLDALGYNVRAGVIFKGENPAQCDICNRLLTIGELGGFINKKLICNTLICLIAAAEEKGE